MMPFENEKIIRFLGASAMVLVLGGLVGCADIPYEASPVYTGIAPDLVWDTTVEVVKREYPMAKINRGKFSFESRWRESLMPMRFQGVRDRVSGRVTQEDEGIRVELRVVKQRNEAMEHPLESRQAEWGSVEGDAMAARILLQEIESILRSYVRERRGA